MGERPWEDGNRDRKDVATSQGRLEAPGAGRGTKDPPPEPLEGAQPCDPFISDSGLHSWEGVDFCRKSPGLWWFVTVAPGN